MRGSSIAGVFRGFAALVAVLVAARLAVMAFTPVFDPSEARYAAISANMARTGDFVVPHFTYEGRYQSFDGKPPLVFQAGGAFCRVFGVNEFAVRLFPFLCAVLLGFLLHHALRKLSGAERARLGVVVYATTAAFYAAAGFAMTDVPLAACVAGALLMYRCFAEDGRLRYAAAVAALLGAGMIVKGPVSFALFALPVLADAVVNRRWGSVFSLKWLYVLPIFLLVAAPWFVLVEQRNPGAVEYFFVNENFRRFLVKDYGDKYGAGRETFRGMALVWTFVATLPWCVLPLWRGRRVPFLPPRSSLASFFFVSVAAMTLFWCLTSRTLVSYLLPASPMFAAFVASEADEGRLRAFAPWAAWIVAAGVAVALFAGPFFSDKMRGAESPQLYGFRNRYSHEFYHGTAPECIGPDVDVGALHLKAREAAK